MVQPPALVLRVHPDRAFRTHGPQADRVAEFAAQWASNHGVRLEQLGCAIRVDEPLPPHSGLGSGTQLALATATLLHHWRGEPVPEVSKLAVSVGRGRRSAIGSYGFCSGGLLFASGQPDDPCNCALTPLAARVEPPSSWHWLVWLDPRRQGIAGHQEEEAFAASARVGSPSEETCSPAQLKELACAVVEAARQADFDAFAEKLYAFGYQAGLQFASVQGGPFHGERLARRVARLRDAGVSGVGQSSWGPTLFAVMPSRSAAEDLATSSRQWPEFEATRVLVGCTDNHGYRVEPL